MCDTFIALPPATAGAAVVFAKNSDRPAGEAQSVCVIGRRRHPPGARLRCTYIEIDQAPLTHAVILSRPDWMWGAEMGANERGVVIGNEAVWTTEPLGPPALLGMDLVRLGLERASSAGHAVGVITALLDEHGQGGACAEGDPSFQYHNAFLIADAAEAWVVETAGRHWAAERVRAGVRNISNGLTIGRRFERASESLAAAARQHRLGRGELDFTAAFSTAPGRPDPASRQEWGRRLLAGRAGAEGARRITPETMMDILGHHESGICMHGAIETTAAMVSSLGGADGDRHWLTGAPHPCRAAFREVAFAAPAAVG